MLNCQFPGKEEKTMPAIIDSQHQTDPQTISESPVSSLFSQLKATPDGLDWGEAARRSA